MSKINIELADGTKAGETLKQLTYQAAKLKNELSLLAPGTEEFVKKAESLNQVKGRLGDIRDQINNTTKASDALKNAWNQLPGAQYFNQISSSFSSMKSGVGGLISQFGLLKTAIAATGIGLLVLAVAALIGWFTKTEAGANMLSGAFKAMGAVIDTLMNRLWNIGDTLKQLFSNPIEFFKNLGKDIKQAAVEGYDLVQVFDDIEDRQRDLDVQAKRNENTIDQLLLQSKNVAKSYQERIALLDKADELTRKSYDDQLALSKEYLAAVDREVAAAEKQGVLGDELLDKQRDARLKVLDLEGQATDIQEKIANRREQIGIKKEKADEKEATTAEKNAQREAELLQEKIENEKKARLNIMELRASDQEKGMQREIDTINAETKQKIEALVGSNEQLTEQRVLLESIAQRKIQEVKDKYAAEETAKKKAKLATDVADNDLQMITQQNLLNEQLMSEQITKQQYVDLSEQNVRNSEQKKLDIIKKSLGVQSKEYQDQYAKILAQDAQFAEAHAKQITQASIGTVNTLGNIFGSLASLQEEGSQEAKDLLVAQAIMSTISGSINAYTSTAAIPLIGPALAPIAAAIAFAAGIANVNKIKNAPLPKPKAKSGKGNFYTGGWTGPGGKYEPRGVVHAGEVVWSQEDVAAFGGVSAVEAIRPTANYYSGGPVNPYTDKSRGPVASVAGNGNMPVDATTFKNELRAEREAMMAYVDKRITNIRVNQNLQEVKGGLNVLQQLKDEADV
jgi:hypothetical protein